MAMKFKVYTDEEFDALQKKVYKDLSLTADNVHQKILDLPKYYTTYRKKYFDQRRLLKNINNDIKRTRKKRYHYYKFDNEDRGYIVDTYNERMLYVDGDDEVCDLMMLHDKQEAIVEFLKSVISQLDKMSYNIRSYIDLEKLRNGSM